MADRSSDAQPVSRRRQASVGRRSAGVEPGVLPVGAYENVRQYVTMALPKWVTDNATSLREEAAPYIGLTPEQRLVMLGAACRAAARLLKARADAEQILARTDALPPSSERALARLRALHSKPNHAPTD
jgi:hypothetical protein